LGGLSTHSNRGQEAVQQRRSRAGWPTQAPSSLEASFCSVALQLVVQALVAAGLGPSWPDFDACSKPRQINRSLWGFPSPFQAAFVYRFCGGFSGLLVVRLPRRWPTDLARHWRSGLEALSLLRIAGAQPELAAPRWVPVVMPCGGGDLTRFKACGGHRLVRPDSSMPVAKPVLQNRSRVDDRGCATRANVVSLCAWRWPAATSRFRCR